IDALDAFSDDLHAQMARQGDERLDNRLRVGFGFDGLNEQSIYFDDIHAKLEDIGKAVVSGADIIQGDAAAEALQRGNDAARSAEIFDLETLGYFKHDL